MVLQVLMELKEVLPKILLKVLELHIKELVQESLENFAFPSMITALNCLSPSCPTQAGSTQLALVVHKPLEKEAGKDAFRIITQVL